MLEKPAPDHGMTEAHVTAVVVFIEHGGGEVGASTP